MAARNAEASGLECGIGPKIEPPPSRSTRASSHHGCHAVGFTRGSIHDRDRSGTVDGDRCRIIDDDSSGGSPVEGRERQLGLETSALPLASRWRLEIVSINEEGLDDGIGLGAPVHRQLELEELTVFVTVIIKVMDEAAAVVRTSDTLPLVPHVDNPVAPIHGRVHAGSIEAYAAIPSPSGLEAARIERRQ